jgi:hypothetical protein
LVFRPWFNNLDYYGFFNAYPFPGIVLVGLLYLGVMLLAIGSIIRYPLVAFGFLFFALAQFPTSSLVYPLRSLVNDRYLYLPMVGVGLLLAHGWVALIARNQNLKPLYAAGLILLLISLGLLTFNRSLDWQDEEHLWKATLKSHPGSIKARIGLSRTCFNQGDTQGALEMALEAVNIAPPGGALSTDALYASAMAFDRLGMPNKTKAYLQRALEEAETEGATLRSNPRLAAICKHLWSIEMKAGRYDQALAVAKKLFEYEGETELTILLRDQAKQHFQEMK